jgi:hypothetical protein
MVFVNLKENFVPSGAGSGSAGTVPVKIYEPVNLPSDPGTYVQIRLA